jgi:hypothetical protein
MNKNASSACEPRPLGTLFVGRPILAAAGFQPALTGCEDSRMAHQTVRRVVYD